MPSKDAARKEQRRGEDSMPRYMGLVAGDFCCHQCQRMGRAMRFSLSRLRPELPPWAPS